ncbi:hypothetical protein Acr_17g0004430 [Actinidia rufa]|uniref:Uncharacterized protein n=1 Tax=Actinidia rufa TaxID=165716 RepID=A0A7J0G268_9ERIC|nr:hypothetical protein Acr_17g0004430 [Actinidia rufa]
MIEMAKFKYFENSSGSKRNSWPPKVTTRTTRSPVSVSSLCPYIEEISRCEQFDAFVPYLAMNYFDRLVSRHRVPDELWRCCDAIETRYKDDQTMNSLIEQLRSEELDIDTTSEPGQASLPLLMASVPPGGSTDHILAANQPMEMLPPPTERTELQCALSRMKEVEEEGSVTREKESACKSPVSTPIDIPMPSGVAERKSPVSVPIDIPVPVRVAERKLMEKRLATILELEESETWEVEEAASETKASTSAVELAETREVEKVASETKASDSVVELAESETREVEEEASETKASTSVGPRRVELRLPLNSIMNFELHWTDPVVPRVTVESLIISDLYDTSASPAEWFKRFTGVSGFAAFLYCIFAITEKRGKSNSSNG